MFKNALISVSDKSKLIEFIKPLADAGLKVTSTGGTAKSLKEAQIKVKEVSELTGFPEVMDGRVKTLHPRVHMCLLSRDSNKNDQSLMEKEGLEAFDLVVVNLYPFENRPDIETIDIGGPTLLRAAAKNHERITVLCDPSDYEWVLKRKTLTLDERRVLASKAFHHVSSYDAMVAKWLSPISAEEIKTDFSLGGSVFQKLRYGENPHQSGVWVREKGVPEGLHNAKQLQGKELSFNNLLDLESSVQCLREFQSEAAAVVVKHNNPCGVAIGANIGEALKKSIEADLVSAFGGIVALNRALDVREAELLTSLFLECVIAPQVTAGALDVLQSKKNLRVLEWPKIQNKYDELDIRKVSGGFVVQSPDKVNGAWNADWKTFGESPTSSIISDLLLSWKVVSHLKSNAICIVGKGQTLGLGMGQVNRVDAVEQAIGRYKKHHSIRNEVVLSSDAFFPFPDSIEKIAEAGIRWVIQPGGSVKDSKVLERASELAVNVILTGERHFSH